MPLIVQVLNKSYDSCLWKDHFSFLSSVLVRYLRSDGKAHAVNLQNPVLAEGRSQSLILRMSGLRRGHINLELYVNCRLVDSAQGLPSFVGLPSKAESVDVRTGQKSYARIQVIHLGQQLMIIFCHAVNVSQSNCTVNLKE